MNRHQESRRQTSTDKLATGLGWFSIGLGLAQMAAPRSTAKLIGLKPEASTQKVMQTYGAREMASGIGILSQPQPATWLWSRVAGDLMDLASLSRAFTARGTDKTRLVAATAAVLGVTALDIKCAQQLSQSNASSQDRGPVQLTRSIVINRNLEDVYAYMQNVSNYSKFMQFVQSVNPMGGGKLHWIMQNPMGRMMEWNSQIVREEPNQFISWRTAEGAPVDASGQVHFERGPGGEGTKVRMDIQLNPAGGAAGRTVAKLAQVLPKTHIEQNLRRLKQILETGEIVQSDASIHTGMHAAQPSMA